MGGDDRVQHGGVRGVDQRGGMQHRVGGHITGRGEPNPVVAQTLTLIAHHPGRVIGIAPFDGTQGVNETGHDPLIPDQHLVDRREGFRFRDIRRGKTMFQALTRRQIRHQGGGQQDAPLHGVHPSVGEPLLIAQSHHMELDISGRVAAGDEVD